VACRCYVVRHCRYAHGCHAGLPVFALCAMNYLVSLLNKCSEINMLSYV
jgi:hypothetical protein